MFKKYRIFKWISIFVVSLIVSIVSFGFWFKSLIPLRDLKAEQASIKSIPYLSEDIHPIKGKILAIVTSTNTMGKSNKKTGYELTELARAYYVFKANGFEVDIASPKGGKPPVVIDDEDMGVYDYAFLNDSIAQNKVAHTIKVSNIVADEYQAVFFAGGKGTMFDFPNNKAIQTIVKKYYQEEKVIGAVCHGPSALVNVVLDNGKPLIADKKISAFTNEEELLLISEARAIFPFLLQDKIVSIGAKFNEGAMYLENISEDKNLITGQNPWSTWSLAESMIKQMGKVPKYREVTGEENAVKVLKTFKNFGKQKAKNKIKEMLLIENKPIDRLLIAKHSIIAAMKGDLTDFFNIIGLVSCVKKHEIKKEKI